MALDAPKVIEVALTDNSTIKIKRKDPFGLLYLEIDKGILPEKYSGAYTTIEYAMEDALKYKDQLKHDIEEANKMMEEIATQELPKKKTKAA